MTTAIEDVKHPIVVVDIEALCTISRKGKAILAKGAVDFLKELPAMGAHTHYVVSDMPQRQLAEAQNTFHSHDMGVYGQRAVTTSEHHPKANAYQHIALVIEQGGKLSAAFSAATPFYPSMPDNVVVITASDNATAEATASGATVIQSNDHDFAALTERLKSVLPDQYIETPANDVEEQTGLRGIFAKRHDNVEAEYVAPSVNTQENERMLRLIAR